MRIERRHIVPLIIGTAVVLVLGFGAVMLRRAEARVNKVALASSAKPVTVIEAKPSSFRATRRYVATLAPWLEARVGPQLVSAYVDTVLVRPGVLVNKGDVLATLDCRNANASSQAVAMQARALDARTQALAHEVSRVQGLLDGGFVSANDLEQRAAQSAAEQAQLLAAKAKLLGTSLEVNDCILRAPFEGEVATRVMDPGAFARPGGAIVTVVDRKIVRLTADVPEGDFDVVRPESPVRIHLLSTSKDLSGKISRWSPAADVSTRTVHFEVDLLDLSRSMPVGTTAEVAIDVGEPLPATEIPLSAAKVRGSKATLFIVDHDVATSVVFEVLGESGGSLYLKTDLEAGTRVVTEGRSLLSNNDRVTARVEPFEVRKTTTATQKAPEGAQAAASTGVAKGQHVTMTRLALRNPIAVLMLCIALVVFAVVVTPRMSVDTFPELSPPVLVIGTKAPGMGPKDVEKTLTWRLEKAVSATPGVDHVQSESRSGLSIIYVWLKWGTDLNSAQTLVQQQVAFAMSSIPKTLGIIPPFVLQYDPSNAPVVQVAVYGGGLSGAQLYDFASNVVEPVFEGIPGVASAAPNGGRERQVNIIIDPAKAQARGITSADIAAAVDRSNALLPSGRFIVPDFAAFVYTNAVAAKVPDIGDAAVKVVDGRAVLIRDVARVEDGGSTDAQSVLVNGDPAVYLNVLRVPGGNVLDIVDGIKDAIKHMNSLPPGLQVVPLFDQSTFVRTTYAGLKKEIFQALVLIGIVILVFLQSPRSVAIAAVAVPICFAIILLVLYATGQTLNAFTMGGLTLAMGPLVDISVVVLESVHRHRLMGMSPYQAALKGTNAVAVPALAATFSTIAVLLPVLLLAGLAKKLFVPLALTVAVAMVAAYFVSMAVTPTACRYLLGHSQHGRVAQRLETAIGRVAEGYSRALRHVLPFRAWVIGAAAVLVVSSGWAASRLPSTFFPEIDESMERVYVRFAPGTSLEVATRKMKEMGTKLSKELPPGSVELVLTNVGSPSKPRSAMNSPNQGPHMGFIRLALSNPEKRSLSQRDIADRMRSILVDNYPGVDFLQAPGGLVASVFSNGYLAPVVVEVRGDDLAEIMDQSKAVAEVARTVPGIRDIYTSLDTDYPEVRVETDRQTAGLVDVSARRAAQTTLEATLGNINTPSVWVDPANGQSYYVVTSYDPTIVTDRNSLAQIPVRATTTAGAISLGSYARIVRSVGPLAVERNQLTRAAHVLMQTEGRDIGSAADELERKLATDPRTKNVHPTFVGQVDLMRTTFSGLGIALGLAVMVVFMIMATQFKSLRLPFAMLFTIPVSLVGIVGALMAAGQGFSITALMGVLMVIGIAVSNGILLVDHANRSFQAGTEAVEAIVQAARVRFVPIAMTSLATIAGLLSTAVGLEHGTESNQPLALAVVGGLASSTVLSLFLVPVMFVLLAKRTEEDPESEAAAVAEVHG